MNKNKFYIRHFDDYHDITSKTYKYMELGCFPTKEDYGYNRYFGLFYNGRKPSLSKVLKSLKRKVELDTCNHKEIHYRTGEEIGITEQELEKEVKDALKQDANEPYIYDD